MTVERTNDPVEALGWALDMLGPGSPAAFLLVPGRFTVAERTADSLSLTLAGRDVVGVAFGPSPPLNDEWQRCLLSSPDPPSALGSLRRSDQWDFFTRAVAESEPGDDVEVVDDDEAVRGFLGQHAPHSAVWPGNPEVVAWYGVSDARGLASVAALVRWESGYHVVSSVATRDDARGRGLAERVMVGVVRAASARHLRWLGLGVGHTNAVAQRLYERVGFERRAQFTVYVTGDAEPSRH